MSECFVIMPISTPETLISTCSNDTDHFKHVLDFLFKPAIEKAGLTAIAPIAEGADVIHAQIIKNLEQADLVLCDMSTLNPNVFFELGIRTAVDKPVCIVKDDATPRIPFDTTIINYHTYLSSIAPWTLEYQIDDLAAHIQKSLSRSNNHNTLWRYFGLSTRAVLPEGKTSIDEKLQLLSLQVEGLSRRLVREPVRPTNAKEEEIVRLQYMGRGVLDKLSEIALSQGVAIAQAGWDDGEMTIFTAKGTFNETTRSKMEKLAQLEGYILKIVEQQES